MLMPTEGCEAVIRGLPLQKRNRNVLVVTYAQRSFIIIIIMVSELLVQALERVQGRREDFITRGQKHSREADNGVNYLISINS